ncbi:hypothetical protein Pd630_LPD00740 [Rhodococcus opacus PD630]|nr:hypothetical protein Pd630_LPD00740 [Rhodococcus opacus PD630]
MTLLGQTRADPPTHRGPDGFHSSSVGPAKPIVVTPRR